MNTGAGDTILDDGSALNILRTSQTIGTASSLAFIVRSRLEDEGCSVYVGSEAVPIPERIRDITR